MPSRKRELKYAARVATVASNSAGGGVGGGGCWITACETPLTAAPMAAMAVPSTARGNACAHPTHARLSLPAVLAPGQGWQHKPSRMPGGSDGRPYSDRRTDWRRRTPSPGQDLQVGVGRANPRGGGSRAQGPHGQMLSQTTHEGGAVLFPRICISTDRGARRRVPHGIAGGVGRADAGGSDGRAQDRGRVLEHDGQDKGVADARYLLPERPVLRRGKKNRGD